MTDVRNYHDRIERAIDRRNVAEAVELTGRMQSEEQSVPELIEEFEAAITAGDRMQARTIRRQLRRRFAEKQTEDERAVKQAQAALESGDIDEETYQQLREAMQTAADTGRLRTGYFTLSGMYDSRLDSVDDLGQLSTAGSELSDRERDLETVRDLIERETRNVTVPARLEFIGGDKRPTVDVADPDSFEVRIENIGGESAGPVEVSADVPNAMRLDPEETTVTGLGPDESEVVEFTPIDLEPGEYQIGVIAQSPQTDGALRTVVLTAEESGGPDALARAFTGPDGTVRFEDVVSAIAHYNEDRVIPESETKRLAFEEVLAVVEQYNSEG